MTLSESISSNISNLTSSLVTSNWRDAGQYLGRIRELAISAFSNRSSDEAKQLYKALDDTKFELPPPPEADQDRSEAYWSGVVRGHSMVVGEIASFCSETELVAGLNLDRHAVACDVLNEIANKSEITTTEISDRLDKGQTAVSRALRRLRNAGLIRTRPEGRKRRHSLTSIGSHQLFAAQCEGQVVVHTGGTAKLRSSDPIANIRIWQRPPHRELDKENLEAGSLDPFANLTNRESSRLKLRSQGQDSVQLEVTG